MIQLQQYPHLKPDKQGNLLINDVNYKEITSKLNTPVYVYSLPRVSENCIRLITILDENKVKSELFYSYKTNSNRKICERIHKHGIGAEVTSLNELETALENGLKGQKIVYDGPYKDEETLKRAVFEEVNLINADSIEEIKLINKIAKESNQTQKIGLTVNLGSNSKNGISFKEKTYIRIKKFTEVCENVEVKALHGHLKTQNYDMESYSRLALYFSKIADKLRKISEVKVEIFDLGGGFPESAIIKDKIDLFAKSIRKVALQLDNPVTYYFEPGRFLIGDAALLLTKVVKVKNVNSRWLILDAGSNTISILSKANHRFIVANNLNENYSTEYNIGGPLPASFDVLTRNYCLPENVKEGDIIAILNTGAYCESFALDYNRPKINRYYIQ